MPERSALKMPCPDTGSKHEAASPTHSSGSEVSRDDAARARRPQRGRSKRPRGADRVAHVLCRAERLHEALGPIQAERAHQIGIAHAGDDAPVLRAAPPCTTSRRRTSRAAARRRRPPRPRTRMTLPTSRSRVSDRTPFWRASDRAAPGRIHQKARRMVRAVVEAHAPPGIHVRGAGDLAHDMRRALGRLRQQHRVEARAVEPPAGLMRLKQEFVAQQAPVRPRR